MTSFNMSKLRPRETMDGLPKLCAIFHVLSICLFCFHIPVRVPAHPPQLQTPISRRKRGARRPSVERL